MQQYAQGIHIRGSRNRFALQLLRSRIFRRHRPSRCNREPRRLLRMSIALQQLGNAEIEQLYLIVFANKYVRRLQIAMHNPMGVRMRHRFQYIEEQSDTRLDIQPVMITVAVDMIALDEFQNEIRLSRPRHARIEQLSNMRMHQQAKNSALALETLFADLPHERNVEELHCDLPLKTAVIPLREPHAAHTTLADLRDQLVDSDSLTCQSRNIRQFDRASLQKPFIDQSAMFKEELFQLLRYDRILGL